ncbi:sugar phosphate isomerase/epimerase [bacterium]|nr:sugar phosphate isomerase/epimerase [bacterium]
MDTGISTLVDLDLPMDELAPMIADAGFKYISLSHDVKHAGYHLPEGRERLLKLWDGLGLKLNYIHPPLECYHDLTSLDQQVRRSTIELMKLAMHATAELGGSSITIHIANDAQIPDEQFPPRIAAGLESLKELLEFAEVVGVTLCQENLPNTFDAGRLSLEIIKATAGWNNLRICLDACHATMQNPHALEFVAGIAPRIFTTHFSDTMGEEDSHLVPGEGNVDFPGIAEIMGKAGYNGVIDLECSVWMLRRRRERGQAHPDDPVPCSTEHYLARAQLAAARIAEQVEDARK